MKIKFIKTSLSFSKTGKDMVEQDLQYYICTSEITKMMQDHRGTVIWIKGDEIHWSLLPIEKILKLLGEDC